MESLFPSDAHFKAFLYANRYEVVYQRVLRHQLFSQAATHGGIGGDGAQTAVYRIRPIEYILASGSKIDSVIVLGMLSQLREGDWHLEDPTGIVRLDLQETVFHEGLFPEGCIVLVEGSYEDNILHVTGMGLPPCEQSDDSRRAFSVNNPFGGGPVGAPAASQDSKMRRLLTTTQAGVDAMLVLLGETRLDRSGCLERLSQLFGGYSSCSPVAFVLSGNFLSPDSTGRSCAERRTTLRRLFRQLITIYRNAFPDLSTASSGKFSGSVQPPHLILVPGPEDPVCAPARLLPRPGLSIDLVQESEGRPSLNGCPNWLHLASNPCRIRLYTREIVIFRAEYTRLLVRHCIHLPTLTDLSEGPDEEEDPSMTAETQPSESPSESLRTELSDGTGPHQMKRNHKLPRGPAERLGVGLARCLASQAHLLPLPGHIAPVYWSWDQALSLNPLPDLVVAVEPGALADLNFSEVSPVQTGNCRFINPGRFGQAVTSKESNALHTEYAFKVYYPNSGVIENSCLPP
ncbi:unnamed protein product [Calicophoron daubneyi]